MAIQLHRTHSQRVGLAVQVLGPHRQRQLLYLPVLDAVEGLQRLGELPVQAGQTATAVVLGETADRTQGICPGQGKMLR